MLSDYTLKELEYKISSVIDEDSEVVFITADLISLGRLYKVKKSDLLDCIYETVMNVTNNKTTIVVPTLSMNLCNTDTVFKKNTYTNMGAFSNYILNTKKSIRSIHPFASYTAIGQKAEYICKNNTPFPYGINSPYDRILTLSNPICLSIGIEPNLTCSIIHHVEFNMHVPYRYIKEFYHPVEIDGNIAYKNFYLHVLYKDMDIKRNLNKKAFNYFQNNGYSIKSVEVGKNKIYKYNLKDFYLSSIELYKEDIYSWLDCEPYKKPYRS